MCGHSTSLIEVRGCRVRLFRGGTGAPLVVLHGASGAGWYPFMQDLSRNFVVIAPENPGFGESDTPDWLDNIHDLAYFHLDLFTTLDLRGVHLVGLSLGAGQLFPENADRNAAAAGLHRSRLDQARAQRQGRRHDAIDRGFDRKRRRHHRRPEDRARKARRLSGPRRFQHRLDQDPVRHAARRDGARQHHRHRRRDHSPLRQRLPERAPKAAAE